MNAFLMDFYPFFMLRLCLKGDIGTGKIGSETPKSTLKSGFHTGAKMQKMQKVQTARPCCGCESAENQYDRLFRPPLLPHPLRGIYSTEIRVMGWNIQQNPVLLWGYSTHFRVKNARIGKGKKTYFGLDLCRFFWKNEGLPPKFGLNSRPKSMPQALKKLEWITLEPIQVFSGFTKDAYDTNKIKFKKSGSY